MVFTKLITEDPHDAVPPTPVAFLYDLRRELDAAEAGREPCSLAIELIAAYDAILLLQTVRPPLPAQNQVVLVSSIASWGHESRDAARSVAGCSDVMAAEAPIWKQRER